MSETPTQAEVIVAGIESRLLDVHTALPGRVVKWDKDTQTAEIELQIRRMVEDEDGRLQPETLPNLPNVMVGFPRSKEFFVSFPLAKDDFVWIIFSEASIDQWRSKGELTVPGDARRHTLTAPLAIPCGYPNDQALTEVHATAMVVGKQGGQKVFIHAAGSVEVTDTVNGSADDNVAQGAKVKSELDLVKTDFTALKSIYDVHTHLHSPGPSAPAPTAPPIAPAPTPHSPASVASSNLKADD